MGGAVFWEHHWSWEKIEVLFYLELWFDDFASKQNMVGYHPIPLSFFCPRNLTVAKLENFYQNVLKINNSSGKSKLKPQYEPTTQLPE